MATEMGMMIETTWELDWINSIPICYSEQMGFAISPWIFYTRKVRP
jgi:hypothetical protein